MLCFSTLVLMLSAPVSSRLALRQDVGKLPSDGKMQSIPATPPADNAFNNGKALFIGLPPDEAPNDDTGPYGSRSLDIPFGRLFKGSLKYFPVNEENTGVNDTDQWIGEAGGIDSPLQSACGIPHNAFYNSHVAIHPYFLKYAGLDRFCMQDVCISFWDEGWTTDMMLKVTDICSTDPSDPTSCGTPGDIKVDRAKIHVWSHGGSTEGNAWPQPAVWFFMKCWADGQVQPAYADNWFAQPPLTSNITWAQHSEGSQAAANQISYPGQNFPIYENCAYNPKCTAAPVDDWIPGQEPSWSPIAGGKGFGNGGGQSASNATGNATSTFSADTGTGTCTGSGSGSGAGTENEIGSGSMLTSTRTACGSGSVPIPTGPGMSFGTVPGGVNSMPTSVDTGNGISQTGGAGASEGSSDAENSPRRWAQCAGNSYNGPTDCPEGWSCQFQNEYYSQCLQSSSGSG